jgi:hypothetical protein
MFFMEARFPPRPVVAWLVFTRPAAKRDSLGVPRVAAHATVDLGFRFQ